MKMWIFNGKPLNLQIHSIWTMIVNWNQPYTVY